MDEATKRAMEKLDAMHRRKRWRSLSADKHAWFFLFLAWDMALAAGISGDKVMQVIFICLSLLAFCYGSYRLRNLEGRLDSLPRDLADGEYEPTMEGDWYLIVMLVLAIGVAIRVGRCVITDTTLQGLDDDDSSTGFLVPEPRGG